MSKKLTKKAKKEQKKKDKKAKKEKKRQEKKARKERRKKKAKKSRARRALEFICPCVSCCCAEGDYAASRRDLLHSLVIFCSC